MDGSTLGAAIALTKKTTGELQNQIDEKLTAPQTAGTSGQVLVSDGNGGQVWGAIGQGNIIVDSTLSVSGAAADAAIVGNLKSDLTSISEDVEGSTITQNAIRVNPLNIVLNGTAYTSSGSYHTYYIEVKKGRSYTFTITYSGNAYYFRFAFSSSVPANGISATFIEEINTSTKPYIYTYTPSENGYLSVSVTTSCNISNCTGSAIGGGLVERVTDTEAEIVNIFNEIEVTNGKVSENTTNIENLINLNRPDDIFTADNFVQGTMYNGTLQKSSTTCITSTDVYIVRQDILLGAFISQANTDNTTWKVRFSFFNSNSGFISQTAYSYYNGNFTADIPATAATFRVSLSLYEGSTNPDITPADYTSARLVGLRFVYKQKYATEEEVGVIPQTLEKYDYHGEKLTFKPYQIAFENHMRITNITSINGSAVFGDYLFTAKNQMDKIAINNMKTKTAVGVITMTAVNTYHCNNINFGNEKYDNNDPFPLLYVSMENSAEHKAVVLRIQESNEEYSASIVQTITYPDNITAGMYYQNCYIDKENNYLYISGSNTESFVAGDGKKIIFKRYSLPLLSAGDVQLTNADILGQFEFDLLTAPQGGFITNNRLFQAYGYGSGADQTKRICMIDLLRGVLATNILISAYGYNTEPESVFMWDNGLYMMNANGYVIKIYT